jgi:hypothetical protein
MRLKEGALGTIGMLTPLPLASSPTSSGFIGNGPATAPNVSTDGIEMEEWEPEDDGGTHHISFTIWDFAGQEVVYTPVR